MTSELLLARLGQVIGVLDREAELLADVTRRLFAHAQPSAAIDNLNRIERWAYLSDVPRWLGKRCLRNRLVPGTHRRSGGGSGQSPSLQSDHAGDLRHLARIRAATPGYSTHGNYE